MPALTGELSRHGAGGTRPGAERSAEPSSLYACRCAYGPGKVVFLRTSHNPTSPKSRRYGYPPPRKTNPRRRSKTRNREKPKSFYRKTKRFEPRQGQPQNSRKIGARGFRPSLSGSAPATDGVSCLYPSWGSQPSTVFSGSRHSQNPPAQTRICIRHTMPGRYFGWGMGWHGVGVEARSRSLTLFLACHGKPASAWASRCSSASNGFFPPSGPGTCF